MVFPRSSVRSKIQVLVFFVVVVPATVIGTIFYFESEEYLALAAATEQRGLFNQMCQRLDQVLGTCRNDLQHFAAMPMLVDLCMNRRYGLNEEAGVIQSELAELFRRTLRRTPAYCGLYFRDDQSALLVSEADEPAHSVPASRLASMPTVFVDGLRFAERREPSGFLFAYEAQVRGRGKGASAESVGVVSIVLRPESVLGVLESAAEPLATSTYALLSGAGQPIFWHGPRGVPGAASAESWGPAIADGTPARSGQLPPPLADYAFPNGWRARLRMDLPSLLAPLGTFRRNALLALGAALVVGLVLSALAASRITRPLVEMGRISDRIASGDFRLDGAVVPPMDHEVQVLWENIHTMAESLRSQDVSIAEHIARLKATQGQLVQAEKMSALGLLVAGVAHELNNPLSGVVTSLRVIEKALETNGGADLVRKHLGLVSTHADHMRTIVNALREYSRLSMNGPLAQLDVNGVVRDALLLVHHQTRRRDLEQTLAATLPLQGDPVNLKQVVVNLVVNAIDATHEGGHIKVGTADGRFEAEDLYVAGYEGRRSDDAGHVTFFHRRLLDSLLRRARDEGLRPGQAAVCLSVTDDGEGIPHELISKIFDPFFTTKPPGKGTGLGLSVVQGIVERHRGLISVTSSPGHGTTFGIKIPAVVSSERTA